MKFRNMAVVLIILSFFIVFSGCGKKEEKKEKEVKIQTEPKEEVDTHEGQTQSKITGLWIDEEVATYRPLAIMMGNTSDAAPQSGIGSASVVYEIPVEGGITRLMSVIEDYKSLNKIGSARSCRYYFVHYAMEYDALYAHFGQSKYALPTLNDPLVNNVNGLEGVAGKAYYRTTDRRAPHNAYADGAKVWDFAVSKGYETTYDEAIQNHFCFAKEDTVNSLENGRDATYVKPGYQIDNPWFEYNKDEQVYYRFQYGKPHIDNETQKQLTCKNIIVQYVKIGLFDDGKSLIIDTVGTGNGEFVTNGKSIPITWKKDSNYEVTHYYDEANNEIELNRGNTWVLLVDQTRTGNVEIK